MSEDIPIETKTGIQHEYYSAGILIVGLAKYNQDIGKYPMTVYQTAQTDLQEHLDPETLTASCFLLEVSGSFDLREQYSEIQFLLARL